MRALRKMTHAIARGEVGVRIVQAESRWLSALTEDVNHLAVNLQSLLESQRELSRAVSHELRTPIARLRFGLALLDEQARSGNERVLDALERSLVELEELVESSLVYARYTQGRPILNLDERPLLPWVREELAPLSLPTNHPALAVGDDCAADLQAMFDPGHLRYALRNLVINALRFASSRVEVTVSRQGMLARIDVDDDGPGVAESEAQRIFEPYVRGRQPEHRPSAGHGLGLSIARRILDWHGGRVELSRSPARGARFSLVWPLDPADKAFPPASDTNRNQTHTDTPATPR
jgi:two-component system sensor histidine kinase RstB